MEIRAAASTGAAPRVRSAARATHRQTGGSSLSIARAIAPAASAGAARTTASAPIVEPDAETPRDLSAANSPIVSTRTVSSKAILRAAAALTPDRGSRRSAGGGDALRAAARTPSAGPAMVAKTSGGTTQAHGVGPGTRSPAATNPIVAPSAVSATDSTTSEVAITGSEAPCAR